MCAVPNQWVVITFRVWCPGAGSEQQARASCYPSFLSSAFTDIMKLATVVVFTPGKSANAMNLYSFFFFENGDVESLLMHLRQYERKIRARCERGKPKTASLCRLAHVSYIPILVRCLCFYLIFWILSGGVTASWRASWPSFQ